MLFCAISNIILEKRTLGGGFSKIIWEDSLHEDCNNIKSRYVRLEDVHLDNKKTMQKFALFLE